MKNVLVSALTAALVVVCFYVLRPAEASRNSSGTMSAISGPYVAGTVISAATVNARLADIESEITDSLSRSGKGGMTAPVRGANGTSTAPTYSFTSETTAGLYRAGAADLRMGFNGTDIGQWSTTTGYTVTLSGATGSAIRALSGGLAVPADIAVGRTAADVQLAVVGAAGQYATGTAQGDGVLRTTTHKLWFDTNSGTGTPSLTIASGNGSVGINNGVAADGSGFKHKRFGSTCQTSGVAGNICGTAVTWTTAFADANYTVTCTGDGATFGVPLLGNVTSKLAAGFTIGTYAATGAIAQHTVIDCIAVHD